MEASLSREDYKTIARIVYGYLCEMDKEQKRRGRVPRWHESKFLAEVLNSYDSRIDTEILSERGLLDELGYIQRDSSTNRIRLSGYGRLMCSTNQVSKESDR